jgi:hypothetical protein
MLHPAVWTVGAAEYLDSMCLPVEIASPVFGQRTISMPIRRTPAVETFVVLLWQEKGKNGLVTPCGSSWSQGEGCYLMTVTVAKVRIRFKVNVIENACLVARAVHLMTHNGFAEGYNLIKNMEGREFLIALRMLAGREAMVKKLSDFKERHKAKQSESIAVLLTRAAEGGDQEATSLLAAGALEMRV